MRPKWTPRSQFRGYGRWFTGGLLYDAELELLAIAKFLVRGGGTANDGFG